MPKKKNQAIPTILKHLDKINYNSRIKIRYKKTDKKGYSLYFDLWNDGKRQYKFIKLYIAGENNTIANDKEVLKYAEILRDKKEKELIQAIAGFSFSNEKAKINFIEYFDKIAKAKGHQNWYSAKKHLINFNSNHIPIKHIDKKFCEGFKEYLINNLHKNTANTYFIKFNAVLNKAVDENIINKNPCKGLYVSKIDTDREFLTYAELKKLIETPSIDKEVKNAFIFSCFTGLRISDVRNLTFDRINNGYLNFRQLKTNGVERIKLHNKAIEILQGQKELRKHSENDKVFLLPLTKDTVNKVIRNWVKDAEIKKKITYHCSRHTAATLLLTFDVDLYTVSKILGHREIKTTQIYAKLIDKKKDEAIDKLPEF